MIVMLKVDCISSARQEAPPPWNGGMYGFLVGVDGNFCKLGLLRECDII